MARAGLGCDARADGVDFIDQYFGSFSNAPEIQLTDVTVNFICNAEIRSEEPPRAPLDCDENRSRESQLLLWQNAGLERNFHRDSGTSGDGFHRAFGLRQDNFSTNPQSHERRDSGHARRWQSRNRWC